jgi:hypothetical protein
MGTDKMAGSEESEERIGEIQGNFSEVKGGTTPLVKLLKGGKNV